jgi:hypothetical protein
MLGAYFVFLLLVLLARMEADSASRVTPVWVDHAIPLITFIFTRQPIIFKFFAK